MSIWFVVRIEVSVSYFLTNRMNQDCIENFFSIVSGKGGNREHRVCRTDWICSYSES